MHPIGSIGVQDTILHNLLCKYILGTTQLHVYRVWYVDSVPNGHFLHVLY